jgi:hypothetical protein
MFCKKLGLVSLPKDVAFFSGVDVDEVRTVFHLIRDRI